MGNFWKGEYREGAYGKSEYGKGEYEKSEYGNHIMEMSKCCEEWKYKQK